MTSADWLMVLAVLLSPFIAVCAQRAIEDYKEKNRRKQWVFHTLMATRGNRLSLEHVQALNSIELLFDGRKDKSILDKWNEYLDHLNTPNASKPGDKDYHIEIKSWLNKSDDLLSDLLQIMGKTLGYNFDKVKIKKGFYVPGGYKRDKDEQDTIRAELIKILNGNKSLPVEIKNIPKQPPSSESVLLGSQENIKPN